MIPSIVNLELTNRCNLECIFCDHSTLKKNMRLGEMDENLLESILISLKTFHIFELGLVGLGEPLLNEKLEKHLDIIDRHNESFTRISLNTNGILLDEAKSKKIINSPVNFVTVSLNASNRKSYEELSSRDRFEEVVLNIKQFLEILRKGERKDFKVSIQFLSSVLNDEKEMKSLFKDYLYDNVIVYKRYVYNKPSVISRANGRVNVASAYKINRFPCWSMYTRVYVDIDGNAYPCTIGNDSYRDKSDMKIGNIKDQNLISIFSSKKINNARKRAENKKISFIECEECTAWQLFPNNFHLEGDKWVLKESNRTRKKELDRAE